EITLAVARGHHAERAERGADGWQLDAVLQDLDRRLEGERVRSGDDHADVALIGRLAGRKHGRGGLAVARRERGLAATGRRATRQDGEVALADDGRRSLRDDVGRQLADPRRGHPFPCREVDDVELRPARAALGQIARRGQRDEPLADAVGDWPRDLACARDLEELRILSREREGLVARAAVLEGVAVTGEDEAGARRIDTRMGAVAEGGGRDVL